MDTAAAAIPNRQPGEAAAAGGKPLTPVFLLSLPRAGSTLIQRILAANPRVATVSEPWLLLPFVYILRGRGMYADYAMDCVFAALKDFCTHLPNGTDDYLAEVRGLAERLYRKAAGPDADYFVDKTPRYHLIADELVRMFPDGKFIFLWRNPLAVLASICETWLEGRWALWRYRIDLVEGVESLMAAFERHRGRVCAVKYEDVVTDPEPSMRRVFDYLGLPFDPGVLSGFSEIALQGRMGDPTGVKQYRQVSREPLGKWQATVSTKVRREYCRRYLSWVGEHRLSLMGYDLNELLEQLGQNPTTRKHAFGDWKRVRKHGWMP